VAFCRRKVQRGPPAQQAHARAAPAICEAKPFPAPVGNHSTTLADPRPSGSHTRTQTVPARIRRVDVRALRQQRFHAPRVALTRRVVQRCALRRAARTKKAALECSTDHRQATGRRCPARRIPVGMAATTQVKVAAAFRASVPLGSAGIRAGCIAPIALPTGTLIRPL
jgi:hypothetical protein